MSRSRIRSRSRSGVVSSLPWYTLGKADDTNPSFWADFANNRYAVNGAEEAFSDIFTFTRSTTGTYFDANGVMQTAAINTPRFDHNPLTGEKLGLLIEEQRTNLKIDSVGNGGTYVGSNLTITANSGIAPDGTNSATKVDFSNASHAYRSSSTTVSASTAYAFTFYAKRGTLTDAVYRVHNLTHGSDIIASTSYYSQINSDNWERITVLFTTPVGCTSVLLYLENSLSTGYMYLWGVQLEQGSFPTSYIPTTSSAVTRGGDDVVSSVSNIITPLSWLNNSEGCIVVKHAPIWYTTGSDGSYIATLEEASGTTNVLAIRMQNHGFSTQGISIAGGSFSASNATGSSAGIEQKAALSYASGNNKVYIDGVDKLGNIQTSAISGTFTKLKIGRSALTANGLNSRIKQFLYYPIRVTNSELVRITT